MLDSADDRPAVGSSSSRSLGPPASTYHGRGYSRAWQASAPPEQSALRRSQAHP